MGFDLRRVKVQTLRLLDGAMHGPRPDHVTAAQQAGDLLKKKHRGD
jgi:hypothetical protein